MVWIPIYLKNRDSKMSKEASSHMRVLQNLNVASSSRLGTVFVLVFHDTDAYLSVCLSVYLHSNQIKCLQFGLSIRLYEIMFLFLFFILKSLQKKKTNLLVTGRFHYTSPHLKNGPCICTLDLIITHGRFITLYWLIK